MDEMIEDLVTLPKDALERALALPPALVDAIKDDPELLVQLTRSQLAIVQDAMVRKAVHNDDTTIGQLATVHERLSKNARIEGRDAAGAGSGTQVVINFIRGAGKEAVVIEGSALEVPDAPVPA